MGNITKQIMCHCIYEFYDSRNCIILCAIKWLEYDPVLQLQNGLNFSPFPILRVFATELCSALLLWP